jgi:hypothetical protein
MSGYEPISVYDNYFCAIDGEGVGNDYVLLDSSLSDVPRLYTGERLRTVEILDWLWNLGKAAGYCTFVLYGAGYDYNNWMRDVPFEDVQRIQRSQPVRVGDYIVLWQQGFKFELRRILREDKTKPEYSNERYRYCRIKTKLGGLHQDYKGLVFWDVLPFWQTSFVKALAMTLGERTLQPELIAEGKAARGSFTHANIEWVSSYNKAECENLALMCVELDSWLSEAGIRPMHYNGPGSAAKALLRLHRPYLHAGRRIDLKQHSVGRMVGEYHYTGADDARAMSMRALSAYAGGLNRQLQIGYHPGTSWQYDIISAYPAAMVGLPCLSHGRWERARTFDPDSFALWKVRYKSSFKKILHPYFWRLPDGSIEYPSFFDERWMHTAELRAGLAVDAKGTTVLDGWKWVPDICDEPYPLQWLHATFQKRAEFKAAGNTGASNALKLPINSMYGSIAQAKGGTLSEPPWAEQLLWAGAITALTRAKLYLAYCLNPSAIVHMATDGVISTNPLPLRLGSALGEWEETELTDLTCLQYGVYFSKEKHRERGFTLADEDVPPFVQRVHETWETSWVTLDVPQKLFVTAGLVAMSEKRYDEWCQWQDVTRMVQLDVDNPFQMGHVKALPGLWPVSDVSFNLRTLGKSTQYEPKWGKGEDFPKEWRVADEYDYALRVEV